MRYNAETGQWEQGSTPSPPQVSYPYSSPQFAYAGGVTPTNDPYPNPAPTPKAPYPNPMPAPAPTPQPGPIPQQAPQQALRPNGQGDMNINTSYQPMPVYPDEYTRLAQNWAAAMATPSTMPYLTRNQQQGVAANSPSIQFNTGLDLSKMLSGGMTSPGQIGMQQGWANAGNMLTGGIGRDQEALGWGQQGAQNLGNMLGLDYAQNAALIQFLKQLMGGWF